MKMMWSREDEFDFDGEFLKLKYLRAKPKPYNGTRPFIMNAAVSDTGRAFAIANCDGLFCSATYGKFEVAAEQVRDVKAKAHAAGRDIDLFTTGVITCRPTAKEAEEYHRHCIIDNADWGAVDHILSMRKITPETHPDYIALRKHAANGMGGLTLIGDPDKIANDLAMLSKTGFAGVAISLMNYGTDFPYFRQEVLPRLAKMGLREEVKS
jgi:alkanesulfonate monooxygenase SsuD/methylene tetrahydromethanopterin reductase-like flavin-dependent oxidoreductase (luciferase family)